MVLLEDTWFVAVFHSTPMHDPGQNQECQRPVQVCVCTVPACTLSSQLLLLAPKTARRSATPAARCATARRLSSGVTLVWPRGCRTKG